ncbi:hypothetical protein V2W45_1520482 [Cenococcum geophilum]
MDPNRSRNSWDDTPTSAPTNTTTFAAPPIFNPYHHLFFANGYVTFSPTSALNVAMFFPGPTLLSSEPFAGNVLPGEIGAGPCASVNAYWFNAYSAFFGCDDGPADCVMQISVLEAQENAMIPTCHGFKNCHLTPVTFSGHSRNLSGIQFDAFINGTGPQVFMMDSLAMGWVNNTCSVGILRIRNRK